MAKLQLLNKIFLIIIAAALGASPAFAQSDQAGTSGSAFLKLDQSVKAAGLGGAFAALANDPSAIYYNPAGLQMLKNKKLSFTNTNWLVGSNYSTICYAQPSGGSDTFGGSVSYLNYGSIQETTAVSRTGTGRSFAPVSYLGILSWARNMRWGYLGVSAKLLQQNIDSYSENGVGVDAGILSATPMEYLRFGASVLNLGWSGDKVLPYTILMGLAYETNFGLDILADMRIPRDALSTIHLGVEYAPIPLLSLRGGINTKANDEAGGNYSLGLGLNLSALNIDYAYVPYADLGATHRIGMEAKF
ncbi:PorV/PorQ family protein [Candidatus Saganbacteria bacterium]|nr:PorV/PorQ family protein [Candidatus Saganbacteria bacterium]